MALGDVIAALAVSLSLETAAFEKGATLAEKRFEQSRKRFESIGKSLTDVGAKMSIGITAPLAALGVASYKAAQESADALGQVNAALASMGDRAGRTSEQLQSLAATQMGQSLYDDDEILRKVTANLLTFGNVSGQTFDKAQQAALDLSARLGTDLQSSAVMVGKALNDPVKGVTALQRVGVSFTAQQKEQITAMTEAGNVAGAQAMILAELEKQYGGAAAAAREADPTAESKQAWAEFQETIGALVVEVLPPLTDFLTKVLDGFNNLSPGMQKVVVVGGALFAALGPVLTVFGSIVTVGAPLLAFFTAIAPAVGALGAALIPLAMNPAVLAFAAVVGGIYLAWKNWDKIEPILRNLYQGAKKWIVDNLIPVINAVLNPIRTVQNAFFRLFDAVVGHSYIPDMVEGIAAEMARLDAVMVAPVSKATTKAQQAFRDMAGEIKTVLDRLFPGTVAERQYQAERAILGNIADPAAREKALRALASERDMAGPGRPEIDFGAKPLDDGVAKVGDAIARLTEKAKVGTVRVAESFKDMVKNVTSSLSELASAIKGGGFFDIVSALLNAGAQLAGTGLLGSKIAQAMNSIPAFANGTNFAPGGLALVGERGPELVELPRGSRVHPNGRGPAIAPAVVQLVVGPGQMFAPTVQAISGEVSVQTVRKASQTAGVRQRQRYGY